MRVFWYYIVLLRDFSKYVEIFRLKLSKHVKIWRKMTKFLLFSIEYGSLKDFTFDSNFSCEIGRKKSKFDEKVHFWRKILKFWLFSLEYESLRDFCEHIVILNLKLSEKSQSLVKNAKVSAIFKRIYEPLRAFIKYITIFHPKLCKRSQNFSKNVKLGENV